MTFSLGLSEDHVAIRDMIHNFAERVMRPAAQYYDEHEEFPWPVVQEAAKIGLYGFDFVKTAAEDPTNQTFPIAMEELFRGDAGCGMAIMGSSLASAGIRANGTDEQANEWVPQCYGDANDVKLGAFCATEADAGSDVSSLRTHAVYDEAKDEWILNGTKVFITNGGIANVHVVVAAVERDLGSRGHAMFIVPPGTKGLTSGPKYKKHGLRASHTAEVNLDDVRVPGDCLLGDKEELDKKLARAREALTNPKVGTSGKQPAMATFEVTRPMVGAQAIGIARAAYEEALKYAKERKQFGKLLIHHQSIAFMLADMATEIEASRALVRRASWLAYNGGCLNGEGSMSKLKAGRTAVSVTERAIQIHGGYGFIREFPVERMHRDAKIYDIFEGTEQIQQLVIARAISGLRIE